MASQSMIPERNQREISPNRVPLRRGRSSDDIRSQSDDDNQPRRIRVPTQLLSDSMSRAVAWTIPHLQPFTGENEEVNVEQWLDDYEDGGRSLGWNDETLKMRLPHSLDGAALRYYRRRKRETYLLDRDNPEVEPENIQWEQLSWRRVKQDFLANFSLIPAKTRLRALLTRPQQPRQSVRDYYEEKMEVGTRLRNDTDDTILCIIDGLRPEYQRVVMGRVYRTPKVLIQQLELIDEMNRKHPNLYRSESSRDSSLRDENRQLKQQLKELTIDRRNDSMANQRRGPRCYNCGAQGHAARNCRAPRYQSNFVAPNQQRPQNYAGNYNAPRYPNTYGYARQNYPINPSNQNLTQAPQPMVGNQGYNPPRNPLTNNYGYSRPNYPMNGPGNNAQTYPRNNYVQNNNSRDFPRNQGTYGAPPNTRFNFVDSQQLEACYEPPAIEDAPTNNMLIETGEIEKYDTLKVNLVGPYAEYKLPITIMGESVKALLDTGATTTIMSYAYLRSHFPKHKLYAAEGITAFAAGGSLLDLKGVAHLPIEYQDVEGKQQTLELPVLIVGDLSCPMIIGRDFINVTNMKLDCMEGKVYCSAPSENTKPPTNLVFGQEKVTIPPKSTKVMSVEIQKPNNQLGIITSSYDTIKKCVINNAIIENKGETINIPVTNFSDTDQIIEKNEVIGEFEEIENIRNEEERKSSCVDLDKTTKYPIDGGEVNIGDTLNEIEKANVGKVLNEFEHLFSFDERLGDCNVTKHEIDTQGAAPIHSAPYRLSPPRRALLDKQVDEWMKAGIIQPSKSPWSSGVVLVPKKNGKIRVCVDLRGVNRLTKKDVYPLPNIDDSLASLNGAIYFSSIDLNQGYLQIRLADDAIPKTAFITQDGLYEFNRMPFGLCNAPATFQRTMDIVLSGLKWNSCLVYLDDIIIFGSSLEEHNQSLIKVLHRIQEAGMTIEPTKCAFAVQEVKFLGHVVNGKGIQMDPDKISSIVNLQPPTNLREVRQLVGMTSYYRKFILNFSQMMQPLTKLTRKDEEFIWGEDQEQAFQKIKEHLTKEPILCHYDPKIPLELRTDACGYGLGAILLHVFPDKKKRVISYASRLIQGAEKNYSITEKECLAIIWAVKKFKHYLQGLKFTIVTDHIALTWLKDKKHLSGRLMRWSLDLQTYDYTVEYRKGKHHQDVDLLSRQPVNVNIIGYGRRGTRERFQDDEELEEEPPNLREIETRELSINDIRQAQHRDEFCRRILDHLDDYSNFTVENELLVTLNPRDEDSHPRIVVPEEILDKVLFQVHDEPISGHCGVRRTLWRFQQRYYIKSALSRVKEYVRTCHFCQTKKSPWTRRMGLLQPLQSTDRPFQRIGIDTLGPFRRSNSGNEKIIVVTDYHTKWAIAKAVPHENAVLIARFLTDEVFLRHGAPEEILSDRGQSFRTELMRDLYEEFSVRHLTTTNYHPQTNGLTERFNRTLSVMLSMYVSEQHRDWDDYLNYVVFAYNTTIQTSTGYSPYYLLFGYQARLTIDIFDPNPNIDNAQRFERLHAARELAIRANIAAQNQQKRQYDKARYTQEFQPGDLVLIHRPRGYIGQTTKLRHPWEGPSEVISRNSDLVYLVRNLNHRLGRNREELVHISRMKPYHSRTGTETDYRNPPTARGTLAWISTIMKVMLLMLLISSTNSLRVVWKPTNFKVLRGLQTLKLKIHYETPCDGSRSLYETPLLETKITRSSRSRSFPYLLQQRTLRNGKINRLTDKFHKWCFKYTHESIEKALPTFCDDQGTLDSSILIDNSQLSINSTRLPTNNTVLPTTPPIMDYSKIVQEYGTPIPIMDYSKIVQEYRTQHPIMDYSKITSPVQEYKETTHPKLKYLRMAPSVDNIREAELSETDNISQYDDEIMNFEPIERYKRSTTLSRKKRFIFTIGALVIGAVIGVGGYYAYSKSTSSSHDSNVEQVAQNTVDQVKELSQSNEEINRRITNLYEKLDSSIIAMQGIEEKLQELEIASSLENQVLVATIVSTYKQVQHDFAEIGELWKHKKINFLFYQTLGLNKYQNDEVPLDLQEPIRCRFDAKSQDITIEIKRKVTNTDIEIVEAHPFPGWMGDWGADCYNTSSDNSKNGNECLVKKPKRVDYIGPKYMAIDKQGCMRRVSPTELSPNTIPIVHEGCVSNEPLYSKEPKDVEIEGSSGEYIKYESIARATTHVEIDGKNLLIQCPYAAISINDGPLRQCYTMGEIIEIPVENNLTVHWNAWYLSHNPGVKPILHFEYTGIEAQATTRFNIPHNFKYLNTSDIQIQIDLAKLKNLTKQIEQENVAHEKYEKSRKPFTFIDVAMFKRHKTKWIKIAVYSAAAVGVVFIAIMIFTCGRAQHKLSLQEKKIETLMMDVRGVEREKNGRSPSRPTEYILVP